MFLYLGLVWWIMAENVTQHVCNKLLVREIHFPNFFTFRCALCNIFEEKLARWNELPADWWTRQCLFGTNSGSVIVGRHRKPSKDRAIDSTSVPKCCLWCNGGDLAFNKRKWRKYLQIEWRGCWLGWMWVNATVLKLTVEGGVYGNGSNKMRGFRAGIWIAG